MLSIMRSHLSMLRQSMPLIPVQTVSLGISLLFVYLIGYFGFHLGWILLAIAFRVFSDSRLAFIDERKKVGIIHSALYDNNILKDLLSRHHLPHPRWDNVEGSERVQWLNHTLKLLWPFMKG